MKTIFESIASALGQVMFTAFALVLFVVLPSCASWMYPPIDEPGNCELYGVVEGGKPMGPILFESALSHDDLVRLCEPYAPEGYDPAGCVIEYPGGVRVYWRAGDPHAEAHQKCHVRNGKPHTGAYDDAIMAGHPAPYFPDVLQAASR